MALLPDQPHTEVDVLFHLIRIDIPHLNPVKSGVPGYAPWRLVGRPSVIAEVEALGPG
jgi:hypothetical protein